MTNAVVKNQTNLPANYDEEADNLLGATAGHEQLLKFVKGRYKIGDDEVPLGTQYAVHANSLVFAWIKFANGEVADRRMGKAADGYKPPQREELGDTDESQWESDDGEPRDPWMFQHLLPFENLESGEVVIFATGSIGGKIATEKLVKAYAYRVKRKQSRALPIVSLSEKDMPTKKYGNVPRPHFEIEGWEDVPDGSPRPVNGGPKTLDGDAKESIAAELNDEIPWK
jgi:hypothetical protein